LLGERRVDEIAGRALRIDLLLRVADEEDLGNVIDVCEEGLVEDAGGTAGGAAHLGSPGCDDLL
jgi:hypothetical protein